MKFSQRIVLMLVAGCICLIYLMISYTGSFQMFSHHRQNVKRFLSNNPIIASLGLGTLDQNACQPDLPDSEGITSTLDLMDKTDYKTYMNGQYNLPHPPVKEVAYGHVIKEFSVIIVPHSHVDPGWLDTVDEYYNGKVKHILDNMVRKLHIYGDMTFIWAEMVFFTKWWDEQSQIIKERTLELIRSGRLEIVSGGWVMPDEASTHYVSVIDQLLEGHQWAVENLGVAPENSWSIDPFGHSGTMPYLWKKSNMKNMVIQRIHQATKAALAAEQSLEFNWKQYWDADGSGDILCHVMPYMLYSLHHTCGPDKFVCARFDYMNIPEDPRFRKVEEVNSENVAKKSQILYEQYRLKSSLYNYNTILVPLGDDFRYSNAVEWDQQYENYKKLMKYMNSKKDWKINIKFGTLKDYFKSIRNIQSNANKDWPVVSGDFFPYSDHDSAYWTGYFSTRPFDKRFSREVESRLRAADILHTLVVTYSTMWNKSYEEFSKNSRKLQEARRNLALFLHHDAITGTGRTYVVQDYENKLDVAFQNTEYVIQASSQFLLTEGRLSGLPILQPELIRGHPYVSSLHQKISPNKDGVRIVLINPAAQHRSEFVEVITSSADFEIRNSIQEVVPYQINPVFSSVSEVDPSTFEVVFPIEIPALGIESYTFTTILLKSKSRNFWAKITMYNTDELIVAPELKFGQERPRRRGNPKTDIYIENDKIAALFRPYNGMLTKFVDKTSHSETVVDINFKAYTSRGSGAYIFFPTGPAQDIVLVAGDTTVRVIEGPFMSEVQVVFLNLLHKVRLYNHPGLQGRNLYIQNALDMSVINMFDRELIMRVQTNIRNKVGEFFTDENGYQMIGRKHNPSDLWLKHIERNYYPMTTMAIVEDKKKRVTLHTSQPHGVASLEKGWLEVMLDRQLIYDDERGLSEGVTDSKLTMSKFVLQIENIVGNHSSSSSSHVRNSASYNNKYTYPSLQSIIQNEFLQQPIQKLYTPINTDIMALKFHPLKNPLPCDTTIVSLRTLLKSDLTYNGTSLILHRKGYMCGFEAVPSHCLATHINLKELLPGVENNDIRETSLTHLVWKKAKVDMEGLHVPPMEIKSYLIRQKLGETQTYP